MYENLAMMTPHVAKMAIVVIAGLAALLVFRNNVVIDTGLLTRDARSELFNRIASTPTFYDQVSTRVESTKEVEKYRWLGTVPQMRDFGNGRLAKGLRAESYDVNASKYEATIEVDRNELADDQTGQIRIRIAELAQRAATHKDYLLGQLLINGGASGYNSYDGVTYFNSAHVSGKSGSQSNDLTFAAATGTTPTAQEFHDAYAQAVETMLGLVDDQGEPMSPDEDGLIVVVPPKLRTIARTALRSQILNQTTNILENEAMVKVFVRLTDATQFFVMKNNGIVRPFIFQDREPIEFGALEIQSEEGFKR